MSLCTTGITPQRQMLFLQPAFHLSSYILLRDPQERLRSNKLLNRTTPCELVGNFISSHSCMPRLLLLLLLLFSITHCSLKAYCAIWVRPGLSTRATMREHPAAEGGTVGEKCQLMLPKCRLTRYIYGSFTCRKATTWDRRLYFPSEGRRAEDFFRPKKNPTASAGCEPANLGTKGQHATSTPPKPLCPG